MASLQREGMTVIAFRDFVPQPLNYTGPSKGIFGSWKVPEFETFEEAVASANAGP